MCKCAEVKRTDWPTLPTGYEEWDFIDDHNDLILIGTKWNSQPEGVNERFMCDFSGVEEGNFPV
jgi:hypothetical protein